MHYDVMRLRRVILSAALVLPLFTTLPHPAWAAQPAPLTLERAIESALALRPELKGYAGDRTALNAFADEAARLPNPELEMEATNFADEAMIGISQTYEFAKKREARSKAAMARAPLLDNERETVAAEISFEVSQAFVAALGARDRLALAEEAYATAKLMADTVSQRVAEGVISPIEETRAKVFLAGAATDHLGARRQLKEAMLDLEAATGSVEGLTGGLSGTIPLLPVVPDKAPLLEAALKGPSMRRWTLERNLHGALLASEEAAKLPDITYTGKVTYDRVNEESGFIVGFSVPIPFFGRNQGALAQARQDREKASLSLKARERALTAEVGRRHASLVLLAEEAALLRESMIDPAAAAHEAVSEGYRQGKFRYVDVLDALKELSGAKMRHLELLISFELEKTALNRLAAPASATSKEN